MISSPEIVKAGLGLVGLDVSKPLKPEHVVWLRRREGVLEFRNIREEDWKPVPETDDWSALIDCVSRTPRFEADISTPEGHRYGFLITKGPAR